MDASIHQSNSQASETELVTALHAYQFGVLDPRATPEAEQHNASILGDTCFGVEVTIPRLAERCARGNLDPQHTGQSSRAAIEDSLELEPPTPGSTLVTVRADMDSVGSMAILDLRAQGVFDKLPGYLVDDIVARVQDIAYSDKSDRGGWQGPRPLPSMSNFWAGELGSNEEVLAKTSLAASISDFKLPITQRVEIMKHYLLTGEAPTDYAQRVSREREDMIRALESGAIKCEKETIEGTDVAWVLSTHRAATGVGYRLAPVVVAVNPEFRFQGGEPHTKITICQFAPGYLDLKVVSEYLNSIEEGWGGSPTIIGSPQGRQSSVTFDQVTAAVRKGILALKSE